MSTEDSTNKNQKIDRRKLKPSLETQKKRTEALRKSFKDNPERNKKISENLKQLWLEKSKTIGLELRNVNTGEVVVLDKPLRRWAIERGLSYRCLHLLIRKKVKTAAGGWYIVGTDPTHKCRKGEKRKPLTKEQKDKKSRAALIRSGMIGPDDEIPEVKNYFDLVDNEKIPKTTSSRLRRLAVKGDPFITKNGWYNKEEALDTIRGVCNKCKIVFCSLSGFNSHKRTHSKEEGVDEFCCLKIQDKFGRERVVSDPSIFSRALGKESIKTKKFITGIYAIVNKHNGKRYIGSSVDIARRWEDHVKMLKAKRHHSQHLQNAWDKGDPEDFEFLILEEVFDKENLYKLEQSHIDEEFKRVGQEGMYNSTLNVLGPPNIDKLKHAVYKIDRKTRQILERYDSIGEAARNNNKATEGTIKLVCRGELVHAGGFAWRYVEEEMSSQYLLKENKSVSARKPVYCLSLDKKTIIKRYSSITEAAEAHNTPRRSVMACIKGYRKTAGGHCFTEDPSSIAFKKEVKRELLCLECGYEDSETLKGLAVHLQFVHGMRSVDYAIKHFYSGKKPKCKIKKCKEHPRYHSLNGKKSFKDYCKNHVEMACSEGGRLRWKKKTEK